MPKSNLTKKDLRPHSLNANKGTDKGRKMLALSLSRLGAGRSIVTDKAGHIIAGNKTFEAAKDRDVLIVPSDGRKLVVVQRTDLDINSKEALELAIADNRVAEIDLDWDPAALKQYTEVDLGMFWSDAELRRILGEGPDLTAPEARIDDAAELLKKWHVKRGQTWQIGTHRLLCADCTKPENWVSLMRGVRANMSFTDPPWNVGIGGDGNPRHKQRPLLENDRLSPAEFKDFLLAFAKNLQEWCTGDVYCILGASEWPSLDAQLREAGYHWSATIIWVKDIFVLGRSKYHRRYEPLWYGWGKSGKSSFNATRDLDDVWEIPRPRNSEEHPTMKPVELVARAIENSSERGGTVVDPFVGAGSTIVAAEKLGRVCYGMDIEPKYVAVTLERMAEMGLEAKVVK